MKTKLALLFIVLFASSFSFAQTNLLDTSSWTLGSGSVSGFNRNGDDDENVRINGVNPFGENAVLWEAVNDAGSNADGGWNTNYIDIDNDKTYRFSVWIKKTNSNDGHTYFGVRTRTAGVETITLLNNVVSDNPYFFVGDLPELDKWYLLVGYVHDKSYTGTVSKGAIYERVTGGNFNKVQALTDWKFTNESTRMLHRAYLYWDTNINNRQYFYAPTIYEVNGDEPEVEDLLNPNSGSNSSGGGQSSSSATSVWSKSGNTISYINNNPTVYVAGTGTGNYNGANLILEATGVNSGNKHAATWLINHRSTTGIATFEMQRRSKETTSNYKGTLLKYRDGEGWDFYTASSPTSDGVSKKMSITADGNVGIGTTTIPTGYKLAVNGKIISEELKVQLQSQWPDYVFKDDYKLLSLEEVAKHIKEKGHLKNIPSAAVVKANGVEVGEMNKLLLEKIEELTLYILQQQKELQSQKVKSQKQQEFNKSLEDRLKTLEKLLIK